MNKTVYVKPQLEVVALNSDVIVTSYKTPDIPLNASLRGNKGAEEDE